jgi:hypothetical protein
MKLNRQLKILLDEAPRQGVPPFVMEKAVIPVLKAFASQLKHLEYYILQSRDPRSASEGNREWMATTLSNIENPQQEKRVIYAFATAEDAIASQENANVLGEIASIPVTHLLFQLLAIDTIDSIIFLETPGNLEKGLDIYRTSLQNSIQKQLQHLEPFPPSNSKKIPSNLA